jgi:hypothetical protein
MMNNEIPSERFFEWLAQETEAAEAAKSPQAPAPLKSRIYSALVRSQASSGPLLSLSEPHQSGLCVFEQLVKIAPAGETVKVLNLCRTCHARILAERMEHAPIYWRNCPYVDFQKG